MMGNMMDEPKRGGRGQEQPERLRPKEGRVRVV
jgi:hypothetical protein